MPVIVVWDLGNCLLSLSDYRKLPTLVVVGERRPREESAQTLQSSCACSLALEDTESFIQNFHNSQGAEGLAKRRDSCGKAGGFISRWVREGRNASGMELEYRSSTSDTNVIYLASYLGLGEPAGHRCDRLCNVEHVWANLYRCKSSNVTHVCDKNCNQKILYDNHTSVCRVSRRFCPLTSAEQEAVRGVRRKRETECHTENCGYKRRHELRPSASDFESSFKMVVPPVSGRFNSGASPMDTN